MFAAIAASAGGIVFYFFNCWRIGDAGKDLFSLLYARF